LDGEFHEALHAGQRGRAPPGPGCGTDARSRHLRQTRLWATHIPAVPEPSLTVMRSGRSRRSNPSVQSVPIVQSGASPIGGVGFCGGSIFVCFSVAGVARGRAQRRGFPFVVNNLNARAQMRGQSIWPANQPHSLHAVSAVKIGSEALQKRRSRRLKLTDDLGHFGRKWHQFAADDFGSARSNSLIMSRAAPARPIPAARTKRFERA